MNLFFEEKGGGAQKAKEVPIASDLKRGEEPQKKKKKEKN